MQDKLLTLSDAIKKVLTKKDKLLVLASGYLQGKPVGSQEAQVAFHQMVDCLPNPRYREYRPEEFLNALYFEHPETHVWVRRTPEDSTRWVETHQGTPYGKCIRPSTLAPLDTELDVILTNFHDPHGLWVKLFSDQSMKEQNIPTTELYVDLRDNSARITNYGMFTLADLNTVVRARDFLLKYPYKITPPR